MPYPDRSVERLGAACVTGAVLTVAAAVAVPFAQASTSVSDDLWRYPWSPDGFVAFCACAGVAHVLIMAGIVALGRSGAVGDSTSGRRGVQAALAGTALLLVGEIASLAVADERLTATGPVVVGSAFGLGTVLTLVGMLIAGHAVRAAGVWADWRRHVPSAIGASAAVIVPMQFTSLLWLSVGVYGASFGVLGWVLRANPAGVARA